MAPSASPELCRDIDIGEDNSVLTISAIWSLASTSREPTCERRLTGVPGGLALPTVPGPSVTAGNRTGDSALSLLCTLPLAPLLLLLEAPLPVLQALPKVPIVPQPLTLPFPLNPTELRWGIDAECANTPLERHGIRRPSPWPSGTHLGKSDFTTSTPPKRALVVPRAEDDMLGATAAGLLLSPAPEGLLGAS